MQPCLQYKLMKRETQPAERIEHFSADFEKPAQFFHATALLRSFAFGGDGESTVADRTFILNGLRIRIDPERPVNHDNHSGPPLFLCR